MYRDIVPEPIDFTRVEVSCSNCTEKVGCPSYSSFAPGKAKVVGMEIELGSGANLRRVFGGICQLQQKPVSIDLGNLPIDNGDKIGLYSLRMLVPTLSIPDIQSLQPAPQAPVVISEAIKHTLG